MISHQNALGQSASWRNAPILTARTEPNLLKARTDHYQKMTDSLSYQLAMRWPAAIVTMLSGAAAAFVTIYQEVVTPYGAEEAMGVAAIAAGTAALTIGAIEHEYSRNIPARLRDFSNNLHFLKLMQQPGANPDHCVIDNEAAPRLPKHELIAADYPLNMRVSDATSPALKRGFNAIRQRLLAKFARNAAALTGPVAATIAIVDWATFASPVTAATTAVAAGATAVAAQLSLPRIAGTLRAAALDYKAAASRDAVFSNQQIANRLSWLGKADLGWLHGPHNLFDRAFGTPVQSIAFTSDELDAVCPALVSAALRQPNIDPLESNLRFLSDAAAARDAQRNVTPPSAAPKLIAPVAALASPVRVPANDTARAKVAVRVAGITGRKRTLLVMGGALVIGGIAAAMLSAGGKPAPQPVRKARKPVQARQQLAA